MNSNADPLRIVLLSGPISSGKSALAATLAARHGAHVIKTRDLIIKQSPKVRDERGALQRAGEKLDKADGGKWLKNALARIIHAAQAESNGNGSLFVVDSVRIPGQVEAVREAYGTAVHHIHLTAEESELERRYVARDTKTQEFPSYADVKRNSTERNIGRLARLADILVATDKCTPDAVFVRATALLQLYPRSTTPLVDVLVGGQYGSEGKGNIVGHIAPEYQLLVRVGGPNAGHQVFAEPAAEVYHHLPSGTGRAPDAKLVLGAGAVIHPQTLLREIAQHGVSADRLSIDPQAMIIEDEDRVEEKQKLGAISSTCQGVGAASARKIMGRGGNSTPAVRLAREVTDLKPFVRDTQELLENAYLRGNRILLEGTQGTSLSVHHGEYPHVTSRDTTVAGCLADAGIATTRVRRVIMVCRTIPIRVGGPSGACQRV